MKNSFKPHALSSMSAIGGILSVRKGMFLTLGNFLCLGLIVSGAIFAENAFALEYISNSVMTRMIANSDGEAPTGEEQGAIITSNGNFSTDDNSVYGTDPGQGRSQSYIKVMSTGVDGQQVNAGYIDITSTGAVTLQSDSEIILDAPTSITDILDVAGATTTNGITNAGNIGTGTLSTTGNATVGGTLGVVGAISGASLDTGAGTIQTTGTVSAGTVLADTVTATTGNITTLNSSTINNTGTISTSLLDVDTNATVGGTLGVGGLATLDSAQVTNGLTVGGPTTLNGATAINNTLGVTGLLSASGGADITGTTNINTTGTAATTIGNTTGTVGITGGSSSILLNNGGMAVVGNTGITGTLTASGNSSLNGATNNIGTTQVSSNNIGMSGSTNTLLGTTNINVNNNNSTNINTGTSAAAVTIGNTNNSVNILGNNNTIGNAGTSTNTMTGASNAMTATGANTISGASNSLAATTGANSITGQTGNTVTATTGNNVLNAVAGANTITGQIGNTLTATTGANTINAAAGANAITGYTNNVITATTGNNTLSADADNQFNTISAIGVNGVNNMTANATSGTNNIEAYYNNMGVATANSINAIGNSSAGTMVIATGGNSTMSVVNGTASLRSGTGPTASGLTSTSSANTLSTNSDTLNTQLNGVGDTASRQNIAGASYVNRLEGDTLINGNTYINGTLVYTSNTSASTTVTSGVSILNDADQATNGQMSINNSGASGATVDANGKIETGIVNQSTASLTLTNGIGNTHGLIVTETQATLSGGTRSSSLTMADNGATFSDAQTGSPVQVHGVDDGTSDYDAVNVRQMAAGVAMAAGLAAIPQVEPGKTFSIGAGSGNYGNQTSLAMGMSARIKNNWILKAGVSMVPSNTQFHQMVNVGVGYSW